MKKKLLGSLLCMAAVMLFAGFGTLTARAAEKEPNEPTQETVEGAVNTWTTVSDKNLTLEDDEGVARIKETKHSSDRSTIDVITNVKGYDVTKAIEFDMYLHNLPFDGENAQNPALTDYWFGMFVTPEYTDEFYTVQDKNDTLNFNMRGYADENGSALVGRYSMPDGRIATYNLERHYSGTDNKITLRFEIGEKRTVVYQKTEKTQDYVEWFFIPEIGRNYFEYGKAWFNMRFHVFSGAKDAEFIDLGLSEIRNTEDFISTDIAEFICSDGLSVSAGAEGKQTAVSTAKYSSLYYRMPVDLTKKVELKFSIKNMSGFVGKDFWLGVFLGNSPKTHSPWPGNAWGSPDAYGILIGAGEKTLGGQLLSNAAPAGDPLVAALQEGENSLVYEMQKTKIVLSLNGEKRALSIDENYFTNHNGYLSFMFNNQNPDASPTVCTLAYHIVNDEAVVLPQIAVRNYTAPVNAEQGKPLAFGYEGDVFVSVGGNGITAEDYTVDAENKTVTFSGEYTKLLPTLETSRFTLAGEQSVCEIEVYVMPDGDTVQIVTRGRRFFFDKSAAVDLEIPVSGDEFVALTGNDVKTTDYTFTAGAGNKGALVFKQAYFSKLKKGDYPFTISGKNSSFEFTVVVQGFPATPVQIVLDGDKGTFNGADAKDIELRSAQGVLVNITGNAITSRDYKFSGGTLILGKEYLSTLQNGEYTFKVYEEEGSFAEYTLTVTNSQIEILPSGSNDNGLLIGGAVLTAVSSVALAAVVTLFVIKQKKRKNEKEEN